MFYWASAGEHWLLTCVVFIMTSRLGHCPCSKLYIVVTGVKKIQVAVWCKQIICAWSNYWGVVTLLHCADLRFRHMKSRQTDWLASYRITIYIRPRTYQYFTIRNRSIFRRRVFFFFESCSWTITCAVDRWAGLTLAPRSSQIHTVRDQIALLSDRWSAVTGVVIHVIYK